MNCLHPNRLYLILLYLIIFIRTFFNMQSWSNPFYLVESSPKTGPTSSAPSRFGPGVLILRLIRQAIWLIDTDAILMPLLQQQFFPSHLNGEIQLATMHRSGPGFIWLINHNDMALCKRKLFGPARKWEHPIAIIEM